MSQRRKKQFLMLPHLQSAGRHPPCSGKAVSAWTVQVLQRLRNACNATHKYPQQKHAVKVQHCGDQRGNWLIRSACVRRRQCKVALSRSCCRKLVVHQVSNAQASFQTDVQLPTRLNGVPHERSVRKFFYKDATAAIQAAVDAGERRIQTRCTIPELNPEMDVFRVGTLLELCRDIAESLALDGKGVKVCVQQAMGQGVFQGIPLSLSGVKQIMQRMDWGDASDFVSFGNVGASCIDDSAFYVLVSPQNVVGNTIMTPLLEMVDEAERQEKYVILINPLLKDIPSSAGVMQVRGRKERMAFEDSFVVAYHFRLLYLSSQCMYPIMGALRRFYGQDWKVFKRVDIAKREEEFQQIGAFSKQPGPAEITPLFAPQPKKPTWKQYWKP